MAKIVLDLGFLKVSASYLQRRSSGLFYYYRRIPADVRGHFGRKRHRVESLKTKADLVALKRAAVLTARDDALWASLRHSAVSGAHMSTPEVRNGARALISQWGVAEGAGHKTGPDAHREISDLVDVLDDYFIGRYGENYERSRKDDTFALNHGSPETFYTPVEAEAVRLVLGDPRKPRVLISDALTHYLENRTKRPSIKFSRDNKAYMAKLIEAVGDLPLTEYRREDVHRFKERLASAGLSTRTIRRTITAISAIFNHGRREFDLSSLGNPFEGVSISEEGADARARTAFSASELQALESACRLRDDDIRHIIAIQADTGARLAEIVGLRIEDLALGEEVPYIHIRPYEALGRTLKTASSQRRVPLLGLALWGADRALASRGQLKEGWLFPRYASDGDVRATTASPTINKWLRGAVKIDKTTHSLRHAMRDRLRHVEAPEEIQDAIGGWSSRGSIGRSYGQGHLLEQLRVWLGKALENNRLTIDAEKQ